MPGILQKNSNEISEYRRTARDVLRYCHENNFELHIEADSEDNRIKVNRYKPLINYVFGHDNDRDFWDYQLYVFVIGIALDEGE